MSNFLDTCVHSLVILSAGQSVRITEILCQVYLPSDTHVGAFHKGLFLKKTLVGDTPTNQIANAK